VGTTGSSQAKRIKKSEQPTVKITSVQVALQSAVQ